MHEQQTDALRVPLKTHKPCTLCGEIKPLSEFYAYKAMRDGRRSECKVCARRKSMENAMSPKGVARRKSRYDAKYADPATREKILADLADYRKIPGNPQRAIERTRKYMSDPANQERSRQWRVDYMSSQERRNEATARRSEWQKNNPDGVRAQRARRRAAKCLAGGSHTRKQIEQLLLDQSCRCANCEADLHVVKRHLDHWMPLALGGSNGIENLQWLCATCNIRKKHLDPIEWLIRLGKACRLGSHIM